jgi:branched-chain amino acid transport system substrate-binding protein
MKKVLLLAVAMTLLVAPLGGGALAADNTIRIATFDPLSGPFKYVGQSYNWGLIFQAREWNRKYGGLFGKKIVIIPYDSQLKPSVAVRLATRAILQKKVHVIATGTGSHIAKALSQVAKKYKTICISYGAEAASLTGPLCHPYFFRISLNTAQHSGALAGYLVGKKKVKRVAIICQDYNFGREAAADFKRALKKFRPDIKIVAEIYHPLMNKDFAPYITKLNASNAQWVFTSNWGPDLGLLIKQGKRLGLKPKMLGYYLEDAIQLTDVQEAAVGFVTVDIGSLYNPNPLQQALNKRYHATWRQFVTSSNTAYQWPGTVTMKTYHIRMLFKAAQAVGEWDVKKIIKKLEGMRFKGINGVAYMRAADHQIQTPVPLIEIIPRSQNPFDKNYPGGRFIKMIPISGTSVPVAETGCKRKPGTF